MLNKKAKLIYLNEEQEEKIKELMKIKKIKNKSELIRQLIEEESRLYKIEHIVNKINLDVIDNKKIILSMYELLKQLYSDMEFENITDINMSKTYKLYKKKKSISHD